jgi:hypothetical protein
MAPIILRSVPDTDHYVHLRDAFPDGIMYREAIRNPKGGGIEVQDLLVANSISENNFSVN